jgi:hypothetical protein
VKQAAGVRISLRTLAVSEGVITMFAVLRMALLASLMLPLSSESESPDIVGQWSGTDWGTVVLNRTNPGEYMGTYSHSVGTLPGEVQLKWSQRERRYNGTWREGEHQFGELSLRLVGDEIRGAHTTDPKSKTDQPRPVLGDVTWTRSALKPVPARAAAPGPPAEPLDLTGFYQVPGSQFEKIRSHPWRAVPIGSQTLGNVPLEIGGMFFLWGEANAKSGAAYAEKVDDIPVKRTFDTLYIYHATFYTSRDGSPVYHLTFQYTNGTSSMTTICYGAHVRDWFQTPDERVTELTDSKSKTVWRANNPDSKADWLLKLRFFITAITNPRPDLEVKSISVSSAKGNSAACILAMTTGPADLLKVDKLSP